MSPYTSLVDLMVDNLHYIHETTKLPVLSTHCTKSNEFLLYKMVMIGMSWGFVSTKVKLPLHVCICMYMYAYATVISTVQVHCWNNNYEKGRDYD